MDNESKIEAYERYCILPSEIWEEAERIAKDAIAWSDDGDEEAIDQYIHETVDGHSWVIFTHAAQMLLASSDHSDAAMDEGTEPDPSGPMFWSQLAYFCLRAEVREALERLERMAEDDQE